MAGVRRTVWPVLALAALALPTHAVASESKLTAEFRQLRGQDTLLQTIGWKLLTGNVRQCEKTAPLSGILLQDAGAYGQPDVMRQMLGLSGDFFVQSVVAGSPAAAAGLTVGDEIVAVDGSDLAQIPLSAQQRWMRLMVVEQRIAQSLAEDGRVTLSTARSDRALTLEGLPGCASRFEMLTGNDKALADGDRIAIGADFVGFAYSEDEFAAALAHELAHNLLGHAQWLEGVGRKRKHIRRTEREADRLMPWLLANSGYDPAAAIRFMRRWGPRHGGGLFRRRTHDGWDERVGFIEAELPLVARSFSVHGSAAWSVDFRREIETE